MKDMKFLHKNKDMMKMKTTLIIHQIHIDIDVEVEYNN